MSERMKITKLWWTWNFDKEEEWLNEMAEQGYALVSAKWCFYEFERTEPGEYIIRLEFQKEDPKYLSFMNDIGAERISYWFGWNYYRRKSELGEFDLFSDLKSKINHLKRIEGILLPVGLLNIGAGLINIANAVNFATGVVWIGIISMFMAGLCFYGYGCVKTKREILEKELRLHE